MSVDHFGKERRLLPFAFFGDVAVVSLAECENGQQMPLFVEIVAQPSPRGAIGGSQLSEWRGAELGMLANESGNFQRVHITDSSQAAAPGVAVSVR
jgi:hypothetical protein